MSALFAALALALQQAPPVVVRPTGPPPPDRALPADQLKATGTVAVDGVARDAALFIDGDRAIIIVGAAGDVAGNHVRVAQTPQEVLPILANARLAFAWPALRDWAGADLVGLRDRVLDDMREGHERGSDTLPDRNTLESLSRGGVAATLKYANALGRSGRLDEAAALLRGEIDRIMRGKSPKRHGFDLMSMTARIANLMVEAGDAAQAIAALDVAPELRQAIGRDYAINLDVNRAAYLAEFGRHAEALAIIDRAQAAYLAGNPSGYAYRLDGSLREFAWIRACALEGMGRREEARVALAPLLQAPERVRDAYADVQPSTRILLRAYRCMRDVEGAAALIARSLDEDAEGIGLGMVLQPALRASVISPPGYHSAVRAHPLLAGKIEARIRDLPPELTPALNNWHTPKSLDAAAAAR